MFESMIKRSGDELCSVYIAIGNKYEEVTSSSLRKCFTGMKYKRRTQSYGN